MYLTRLLLNPVSPEARRDLAAPYELHRTLKRAFPNGEPDANRLLFRIEPADEARGEGVPVLVQTSTAQPDWSFAEAMGDYALHLDGPKPFDPTLTEGQRLRFRFVGNPTVRKTPPGAENGRRVPLIHSGPNAAGHPTYFEWLDRQAERCGFAVLDVQDAPFRLAPGRKKREYAKRDLPLFGVRFDGVLTVTDPATLTEALKSGIGPAKAFGFGLLSLARVA